MLTETRLIEIIKLALKEQFPNQYKHLSSEGSLNEFAQLRAQAALETRDFLMDRARDEALTGDQDMLPRVQLQMRRNREANSEAIRQATEFPSEDSEY